MVRGLGSRCVGRVCGADGAATRKTSAGFMYIFIKSQECKQACRSEHFLFTSTVSANFNKSLCRLLYWPFHSYPFVVPTGHRHLFKFFYIVPNSTKMAPYKLEW